VLVDVALELQEHIDEPRNVIVFGVAGLQAVRAFPHDGELAGQFFMLRCEPVHNRVERRLSPVEGREEVLVFGLVMVIEQFRVGVEHANQLVESPLVRTR